MDLDKSIMRYFEALSSTSAQRIDLYYVFPRMFTCVKAVLAVAANLFLALKEPKCLSKYKKGAKFYRVGIL